MALIVRDPPVPPSPVGLYGSDSVSFLQSGAGAVTQTMQEKGRQVVNAADYGTKLATTPAADINLAITYANGLTNGGVVVVKPGSYTAETTILQKSNVYLDLTGVTFTAATGLNAPIIKNSTSVSSGTCTITRTNRTATATKNSHGFSNGDWVFINGANQLGYNGAHKIFNVAANTFGFFVEKTTTTPATGTINVYKSTDTNLGITGGELVGNAANTTGSNYGIEYNGVERFFLNGTFVRDTYHTCIAIDSGANGSLFNVTGNGAIHAQHNGCYLGTTNAGPSATYSYVYNIALLGCTFDGNGQTGIEFVEGRKVTAIGTRVRANGPGITARGVSELVIANSIADENTNHGIELFLAEGASDIVLSGNSCCHNGDAGIFLGNRDSSATSYRVSLNGNVCNYNNQTTTPTAAYGIAVENTAACTLDYINIANNVCNNNSRGISFSDNGTASHVSLLNNICQNNTADFNFGTGLETATFQYGLNVGTNGVNGIKLRAVATAGISLGNTANTDGNFLDWYEEGSWVPVLTFATPGNLIVAYTNQVGRYTRIGDTLYLWGHIFTSTFTHTTASGNLQVTGSPYTAVNVSGLTQISSGMAWGGVTKANYTQVAPSMGANSAIVQFVASGSAQSVAFLTTADMPTGGAVDFYFTMTLKVQ